MTASELPPYIVSEHLSEVQLLKVARGTQPTWLHYGGCPTVHGRGAILSALLLLSTDMLS